MSKSKDTIKLGSQAEDLFIGIFTEVFGIENTEYLSIQQSFVDYYGNYRYIDFALENEESKIAIEIDGELWHNPTKVSPEKYYDDLLKQNSLIHQNWQVYRWTYNQLNKRREEVKDQLLTFVGEYSEFKALNEYLPKQKGKILSLKNHQKEAIDNLNKMRTEGNTIGLLYHATGVGKTVTAVSDAKRLGKRTLFLAHTKELVEQSRKTFKNIWSDVNTTTYVGENKDKDGYVVCGSVQSISNNIEQFNSEDFGYIIIDEAHHSSASTYKKILSYFKPDFTLGLTATPERADGEEIIELFKNVAHKLDLQTAVEIGELTPVRCIRIKTNIDFTNVRIKGIKYNYQDLESNLFVNDRNEIIVNTYKDYVNNKKTVIFCASVKHAEVIAKLFREIGYNAHAVSGATKQSKRKQILEEYEHGDINILCACDLLNEGWDSPKTEVLFMARPTMSKTIYLQQLGRGMRKSEDKDYLMVFDFIDNTNMFNIPLSVHRMFNIKNYRPSEYVLAPKSLKKLEEDLLRKSEKPDVYLDFPLYIKDYEEIDIFNWRDEIKNMISQNEFIRMVSIQRETINRYIREGKIIPDRVIETGYTNFNFFKEETVKKYANEFNWTLITPANMKDQFIKMVEKMDMSYSYKPVLLLAMLDYVDKKGRVKVNDLVDYFIGFYDGRRKSGLIVEKKKCLYLKEKYTRKEVERNIFSNPFKRFEDMGFMKRCKDIEYVEFNRFVWRRLNDKDKKYVVEKCNKALERYYE